ncbi:MAG TPA: urease accessory protein UreD [Thiomonas arsenitoxydans]|uniref:urease accessory protein UreD n=1 Tax=Thiomonas TaxID=32012 RepID=UPI00257CFD17|nr:MULTISPECIES: urease accessory protein UreD [Thiomonas]HML83036.1 urease accessory protein UreD [Thiomonas arsenitoxydans]
MTPWHSRLQLRFSAEPARTVLRHQHEGGLRALASHYPEDPQICHQVLVHPPGGLVGGDILDIDLSVQEGAHALVTTPGAGRFYRSTGAPARQTLEARLAPGARLEWLPLETLAYNDCLGENRSRFHLAPGAELMAWDLLALGLPAADAAFRSGRFTQHIELPGIWLERGCIAGDDDALLYGPGGLRGHTALATLFFAAGSPLASPRREALLDVARQAADDAQQASVLFGATAPHAQIVALRVLGHRIEPVAALCRAVWAAWRQTGWGVEDCAPRVWST